MSTLLSKLKQVPGVEMASRKRDGTIILRKGYFYSGGKSSADFRDIIAARTHDLPIRIMDHGDHWAAFSGGAPLQRQTHWWVIVKEK